MYEFPGVTFHPWVGANFGRESRFGVRLLVLGESHYDNDPEYSDCGFTQEVVRDWGQNHRQQFFTKIAKVLLGHREWINDDVRSEIWEHTAFYDFVQSVVSAPRAPPKSRQWCEAQAPFNTVLKSLKPDAVLILGSRLSDHVLNRQDNVTFSAIVHPSSGHFRYNEAIPAFKTLLANTKRRIAQQ